MAKPTDHKTLQGECGENKAAGATRCRRLTLHCKALIGMVLVANGSQLGVRQNVTSSGPVTGMILASTPGCVTKCRRGTQGGPGGTSFASSQLENF